MQGQPYNEAINVVLAVVSDRDKADGNTSRQTDRHLNIEVGLNTGVSSNGT